MFSLPNFCRVCLKYDKNLINLAHIENEPNETLMSKLQLCVSEVEWDTFKPLLCHPCIKRLNIAYSFKKQCVQSAGVLNNYVELVKESHRKNESQAKIDATANSGAYMLLPNQKYVKILVGSQNQGTKGNANTFQNVFLNLIPTTTISPVIPSDKKNNDTNQNVFLNLNNSFQKFIPLNNTTPPPLTQAQEADKKQKSASKNKLNVVEYFGESNAEDMSVEIDPTSFLSVVHDDPSGSEDADEIESKHDWDEVITKTKIDPKKRVNGNSSKGNENFVPIISKDLYSGGHFLSASEQSDLICEACQKTFNTKRLLKNHMKLYHMGKFPFKCTYCFTEYLMRSDYESCILRHQKETDSQNTSLTLKDFSGNSSVEDDALSISIISETPADLNLEPNEKGEFVCEHCKRTFYSSAGLLRHRVRKHNQKNRKKYFIKGMKNARCDICNRDFSTQSYMQLHRKLHLREDGGYKYKVQGRSKYKNLPDDDKEQKENGENQESTEVMDVTPDVSAIQNQEDSDTESEQELEQSAKKQKLDDDGSSDSTEGKNEANTEDSTHVNTDKKNESSESSDESESNSDQSNVEK